MFRISVGLVSIAALLGPQLVSVGHAQDIAPSSDSTEVMLEPITISARKRQEELQDAPVSVTVRTSEDMGTGKINSLEDVMQLAPNAIYNPHSGPVTIRGVGSIGSAGGLDRQMGVGVFIDEVFVGRAEAIPDYLDDLARVEIVRGSQSTLYGKNTMGGAINMVTEEPGDSFSAWAEVTGGNLSARKIKAAVDTPTEDGSVRVRSFFTYTQRDGYIKNTTQNIYESNIDSIGGRITVMSDPTKDTRVKLTADYEDDNGDGGTPFVPVQLALQRKSNVDFKPENDKSRGGVTAKVEHLLPIGDFTSITAYRTYDLDVVLDGDFTSANTLGQGQLEDQWQVSQEFRLASLAKDGPAQTGDLRWMAGGFFMYEEFEGVQQYDQTTDSRDRWDDNSLDLTASTYSAFTELGYYVAPATEVSGGLRLTHEKKDGKAKVTSASGSNFFGTPAEVSATPSYTNISPEVAIKHNLSSNVLGFAKISRGFKAGGVSQFIDAGTTANTYDPETSWNYEIGTKTSWFNNRLHTNLSAFYVDWKNQQARVTVDQGPPIQRAIRNAAAAHSSGIEVEGSARLSESLKIDVTYGFQEGQYDDFVDTLSNTDYSGHQLPNAPKHSLGVSAQWDHNLSEDLLLSFRPAYKFRNRYSLDAEGAYRQPVTHIFDVSVAIEAENWGVSFWGKNLSDEQYLKGYFRSNGTDYGVAAEGRTVGMSLNAYW